MRKETRKEKKGKVNEQSHESGGHKVVLKNCESAVFYLQTGRSLRGVRGVQQPTEGRWKSRANAHRAIIYSLQPNQPLNLY